MVLVIEMIFSKTNKSPTHQASAWGLVWRDPKGFLISTNFRGSSSHFCFDHFYIVDFHSALTFAKRDLRREDWVKIYKLTLDKGLISGESADVAEKLFHGTFPTWLWWINILNIMMLVKLGLMLTFLWETQRMKMKSHTNAANATLHLVMKALWEHIWRFAVEKSQTNATNVTMHPLRQAIWGHI